MLVYLVPNEMPKISFSFSCYIFTYHILQKFYVNCVISDSPNEKYIVCKTMVLKPGVTRYTIASIAKTFNLFLIYKQRSGLLLCPCFGLSPRDSCDNEAMEFGNAYGPGVCHRATSLWVTTVHVVASGV